MRARRDGMRRVLRRVAGRHGRPRQAGLVQRQGLRRHAVVQAVLRLRRPRLAARRPRPSRRPPARALAPVATAAWDAPLTRPTSCPCRTAWEYPWFAAWDLAFHCVTFALIDPGLRQGAAGAASLQSRFIHAQRPAAGLRMEVRGDTNPPVHALAALQIYDIDRARCGHADTHVPAARVQQADRSTSPGGSTTKDEAGPRHLRRRLPGARQHLAVRPQQGQLPEGGHLDQADGTAWAAVYALNLMRMAIELALDDHVYEDMAIKFFEHFLLIAAARCTATSALGDSRAVGPGGRLLLRRAGGARASRRCRCKRALHGRADPVVRRRADATATRSRAPARLRQAPRNGSSPTVPTWRSLVSRWRDTNSADYSLLALMRKQRLNRVLTR